ncbi:MAG: hypothetical protein AAF772_08910 [Acidobacteriota bacterium]
MSLDGISWNPSSTPLDTFTLDGGALDSGQEGQHAYGDGHQPQTDGGAPPWLQTDGVNSVNAGDLSANGGLQLDASSTDHYVDASGFNPELFGADQAGYENRGAAIDAGAQVDFHLAGSYHEVLRRDGMDALHDPTLNDFERLVQNSGDATGYALSSADAIGDTPDIAAFNPSQDAVTMQEGAGSGHDAAGRGDADLGDHATPYGHGTIHDSAQAPSSPGAMSVQDLMFVMGSGVPL